jgi:hypothetical protein
MTDVPADKPQIAPATPLREVNGFNSMAPCRLASSESDMRGCCLRCRREIGQPCPEQQ